MGTTHPSGPTRVLMLGLLGNEPATIRYYGGIARTLDATRFSLLFGTVREAGGVQEAVARYGHATFSLDCRSARDYPRAILSLARIIREHAIDIVHGNEELPSFLSGQAALLARRGVRIYHRQHDACVSFDPSAPPEGSLRTRLASRLSSAKYSAVDRIAGAAAQVVFTLSANHCGTVLRERPRWKPKVRVVPHGVDQPPDWEPHRIRAAAIRRDLGLRSGEPTLTIVARLNWRKGHGILFDALAHWPGSGSPPALLVVGEGPLAQELEAHARARRLDRVFFVGSQSDVWSYYLAGDLALVPSLNEPFGLVSIEAMACGRPVIASAVGGLREIVIDRLTGRLVPPGEPTALAAAMAELLGDPGRLSAMGQAARERYLAEYSQEAMTRRWQDEYRELTAPPPWARQGR